MTYKIQRRFSGQVTIVAVTAALLFALATAVAQTAQAQTYKVLYRFPSFASGAQPSGSLLLVGASLYGTTTTGGLGGGPYGFGAVYRFDIQTGQETLLHSFAGPPTDGELPYAGLVVDSAGNLYGTTYYGGLNNLGAVFMVCRTGTETLLHSFSGPDGAHPVGGLVRDAAGNLYGTTVGGGIVSNACRTNIGGDTCGIVFKLNAAGDLTTLHRFRGSPDGANPYSTMVLQAGNLYGNTSSGGASNLGTVFQINGQTGEESVLYSFSGGGDGNDPASLISDGTGNFYGTTNFGGGGNGVVFALNVGLREQSVLHTFSGIDGALPDALVTGLQGKLWGTTYSAALDYGTIFVLDPKSGSLITIHSFQGGTDGAYPGGLVRDSQGNLYGITAGGGMLNDGTIFAVTR